MVGVTAFTFFAGTLAACHSAGSLPQALAAAPWSHIAALLWLGIAPTFIGYLAWNAALRRASASQVIQLHLLLAADRGADRLAVAGRSTRMR